MGNVFLARTRASVRAVVGALAWVGCGDSSPATIPLGTGGSGGATPDGGTIPISDGSIPPGGGVGAACSAAMSCRVGLVCTANACALGHSLPIGSGCVLNGECAAGAICTWVGGTHQCAPGGTGTSGAACKSDADCTDGLRCAIVGFGAQCQPEGSGDVNAACTTSGDCLGGLACLAGRCGLSPPGFPPFGVPTWPGETCEEESGPPISHFRVPRGTGDKDFYRLPFPNDIRRWNGHPDLHGHPVPGPGVLGFDAVDRYLRAIEEDNDGFGAYPTVFFRFNTPFDLLDPSAPDAAAPSPGASRISVDYIDLTLGTDYGAPAGIAGMHWLRDFGRGKYICANYLAVRALDGYPLKPGHTYALIVHDVTAVPSGAAVQAGDDFPAMVAPIPPSDSALGAAYRAYQPLRDYLVVKSIAPARIVNAAVFTVGAIRKEVTNLQKAIQALPAPVATGWVKCGAGPSPCPDASGDRACPATGDPAFDELHALVPLPIFQSGTAPYWNPSEGGRINSDAPAVVRTESVCLSLTVPKATTMPAKGWPLVIYAHGTGGSFRSHVQEGVAKTLASASGDNTIPFAVLGIDQVEHGPRRGTSTASPENLFYNFANPRAARDNAVQGGADQMSLTKFAASLDIKDLGLTGAEVKIDPAAITFWGHSQGATEGGIAAPYMAELAGVVFSGQGASLLDALLTKTSPVDIAAALPFALSDVDPSTPSGLRGDGMHPVLSLLQMYLDPADPLNHAALIAPAALGGHHVFQVYGQKDTFSPPITEMTYAVAAQLSVAPHDSSVTTADYPQQLPEKSGSISANVGGRLTAVVRQYAPPAGIDGHFVAYQNPTARRDVVRFLDDLAKGIAPTVAP